MPRKPDPDDSGDRDRPLDGLAADVARRRAARAGEAPGSSVKELGPVGDDDRFTEEPFETVEALWESVDLEEATLGDQSGIDDGGGVGTVVISKRNFCERCEYFSEPPVAQCTHEGTDIVEFVDRELVRVRRCPIVAQRRAIGQMDHEG